MYERLKLRLWMRVHENLSAHARTCIYADDRAGSWHSARIFHVRVCVCVFAHAHMCVRLLARMC